MSKKEAVQDLLSLLAEENVDGRNKAERRVEGNDNGGEQKKYTARPQVVRLSFYLWDKKYGKTTAQNFFLNPAKDDTQSLLWLEYTYGRRSSNNSLQKDIAHIWELGGGKKLADLIKVPMSLERFLNFHVVICIDLSKPSKCFDSLKMWMEIINKRIEECMAQLERSRKGKKILQEIRERLDSKYKSHRIAAS